jgi:hypothetical protein
MTTAKNPAAVALGRLGGLANKGIPKPKSAENGRRAAKPKPKRKLRALKPGERRASDGTIYKAPVKYAGLFKKYKVRVSECRVGDLTVADGIVASDDGIFRAMDAILKGRAVEMVMVERRAGLPQVVEGIDQFAAARRIGARVMVFEVPARNLGAFHIEAEG